MDVMIRERAESRKRHYEAIVFLIVLAVLIGLGVPSLRIFTKTGEEVAVAGAWMMVVGIYMMPTGATPQERTRRSILGAFIFIAGSLGLGVAVINMRAKKQ